MIEWNGYRIHVWAIAYRDLEHGYLCEYDTMKEVKNHVKENFPDLDDVTFKWCAAEEVDDEGNMNPPCWGDTRAEAVRELKRTLGKR